MFYVGKGCGARSGQHIKEAFKSGKQQRFKPFIILLVQVYLFVYLIFIICFSAKLDRINEILDTDQPSAGRKYGLGKYHYLWSISYGPYKYS